MPIGIVALILGMRLLPRDIAVPKSERRPLDLVGAVLLGAAVVALMLPLVLAEGNRRVPRGGWSAWRCCSYCSSSRGSGGPAGRTDTRW